jgi:hypothetical protein
MKQQLITNGQLLTARCKQTHPNSLPYSNSFLAVVYTHRLAA